MDSIILSNVPTLHRLDLVWGRPISINLINYRLPYDTLLVLTSIDSLALRFKRKTFQSITILVKVHFFLVSEESSSFYSGRLDSADD